MCAARENQSVHVMQEYGRLARSFSEHHGQRISHAIVMTDALNICDGIGKLKKRLLTQRRAA